MARWTSLSLTFTCISVSRCSLRAPLTCRFTYRTPDNVHADLKTRMPQELQCRLKSFHLEQQCNEFTAMQSRAPLPDIVMICRSQL
ncbi:hypothetical protein BDY19DRAFT_591218 [Irpex rosettiformis]|uniref:Uncharacterized protein n=1 Tax=Irpex rosettiformis TaxID=378272 RepID=A0ACB8UDB2_9APHY|nr:hypothetical protein BDY19DRAFT_591218 [Irpex rosettiformis]